MRTRRLAKAAPLLVAAGVLAACSAAPKPAGSGGTLGQGTYIPGLSSPAPGTPVAAADGTTAVGSTPETPGAPGAPAGASQAATDSGGASAPVPGSTVGGGGGPAAGPAAGGTTGTGTGTGSAPAVNGSHPAPGRAGATTAPAKKGSTGGTTSGRPSGGSTGGSTGTSSRGSTGSTGGSTSSGGSAGIANPLYTGPLDTRGITASDITLCAHAALTYGAAFNTTKDDFNVFWSALNDAGGVNGRAVHEDYINDNYDPDTAVQAATTCQGQNPFMILGGIGFDQIPKVRNWAEANKELYFYHDATVNGEAGKRYSFTALPSVEQLGAEFGLLAKSRFAKQKIGILHRDSAEWNPGHDAFLQIAKQNGLTIGKDIAVQKNQGSYTQALVDLKNDGDTVVWVWENALAATEVVKQAKGQLYNPNFLVFPFNLTTQTLGNDALNPPMLGIASWPAYSQGDYGGPFAPYASDIKLFEQQYAKYRPSVDLSGVGGDLLFLNWEAQKGIYQIFKDCGRDCTRSKFAAMLEGGYHWTDITGCSIDFRPGDHHLGGRQVSVFESYTNPAGKVNWRPQQLCRELVS